MLNEEKNKSKTHMHYTQLNIPNELRSFKFPFFLLFMFFQFQNSKGNETRQMMQNGTQHIWDSREFMKIE